jgi:CHAD domain-containing protein
MAAVAFEPDVAVRRTAQSILPALVQRVGLHAAAARAGEPEAGVHQMRVALKRLREGLRLFESALKPRPYRKWRAAVEVLNDRLGAVRELDVLRARLQSLGADDNPAGTLLDVHVRALRIEAQVALARALDAGPALVKLARFVARRESYRKRRGREPGGAFLRRAVLRRLEKAEAQWERARADPTPVNLHRARIRNKHLRYALEPALGLFAPGTKALYKRLVGLHDVLGDVHDDEVLLRALAEGLTRAHAVQFRSYEALIAQVDARRAAAVARFGAARDDFDAAGGFAKLRLLVGAAPRSR